MGGLRAPRRKYFHNVLKRCFKCGLPYANGVKRDDCCKLYSEFIAEYHFQKRHPTFFMYVEQKDREAHEHVPLS